jgi:hypothetical protein
LENLPCRVDLEAASTRRAAPDTPSGRPLKAGAPYDTATPVSSFSSVPSEEVVSANRATRMKWYVGGLALAMAAVWTGLFFASRPNPPTGAAVLEPALKEASGITTSDRTADLLWAINDSKGAADIYGIAYDGRRLGTLRLQGVQNEDWEAISLFRLDGQSWLAIGDVGDNSAKRRQCTIHLLPEPSAAELSPSKVTHVQVARTIRYRYEDGPRDCESMTVDPRTRTIVLISKRWKPPALYTLSLDTPPGKLAVAKRAAYVHHLPQPTWIQKLIPTPTGRYRGMPTDVALSPDGTRVALLTYGELLLFGRDPGAAWSNVFENPPRVLAPHQLLQAEAVCFSADGASLFVMGEQKDPLLLRYAVPPSGE